MAHRSRIAAFVLDCQVDDLGPATAFWSQALGQAVANADEDGDGRYAELQAVPGHPHMLLQRVGHHSHIHLDIETDDLDAEVARLEALGARRVAFVKRWWVMEAPTGQRFCVVRMKHPERGAPPREWP
ncbi:MAG TPA: VOC family protein [Xanthomonadaceae bacterium]|nr:VOC family protein [Xanthomonadaceae bacterium]